MLFRVWLIETWFSCWLTVLVFRVGLIETRFRGFWLTGLAFRWGLSVHVLFVRFGLLVLRVCLSKHVVLVVGFLCFAWAYRNMFSFFVLTFFV